MKYVVSKLSYNQEFTFYAPRVGAGGGANVRTGGVIVKGGSNVRDPRTLVMPEGVVTEVEDTDAERLAAHPLFAMYEKNGMMKMLGARRDANSAKRDLAPKDGAAQKTKRDYRRKSVRPIDADED